MTTDAGQDSGVMDAGGPAATFFGANDAGAANITTPALLVDNDYSDNNRLVPQPVPSPSDVTFGLVANGLPGLTYSLWIVPGDGSGSARPAIADLTNVHLILWYTGANDSTVGNGTLTAAQEAALITWLNLGNNTLAIFSPSLVKDLGSNDWTTPPTDVLLAAELGVTLDKWNPSQADGGTDVDWTSLASFDATGSGSPFLGKKWHILTSGATVVSPANVSIVQVDAGINTLLTVQADPLDSGTNLSAPVVIGNLGAGAMHNSKIIFVGFPIENNAGGDAGNTEPQFFNGLGFYLGL